MRLRRILGAVSWHYAVGETLLIVIGVTLALAATSWYENHQERVTEQQMLAQIGEDLLEKRALLEERLESHRQLAKDIRQLITFIESDDQDASPFSGLFSSVGRFYGFRINASIYEVLKSRGLDLISDNDLRDRIVSFYEDAYPSIYDTSQIDRSNSTSQVVPYLNEHFIADNDNAWLPEDLAFVREDGVIRNLSITRLSRIETYSLPSHEQALAEIDAILALLE